MHAMKVLIHLLYACLTISTQQSHIEHLNHHQALRDEQHGFRQHRSCETQLITTVHDFA